MKRLFLVLAIISLFSTSCSCQENGKKDNSGSESVKAENARVKSITYNDFKNKIWDFEKSPDKFVYKGNKPCIIDFYASWCGPCKTTAPILDKLAKEYGEKVDFYKVDTDKEQKLSMVMQIQYLPTIYFISDKIGERSAGAKDEAFFRRQIKKLLGE